MRIFGEIEGIAVGTECASRAELAALGVHKPTQAGISGSKTDGADSIVVSGGYEDDEDYGDYIVYTGQGGNDPTTKQQIADQELTRGNHWAGRSARRKCALRRTPRQRRPARGRLEDPRPR